MSRIITDRVISTGQPLPMKKKVAYIRFNCSRQLRNEMLKLAKLSNKGLSEWIRQTLKHEIKNMTGTKIKD